MRRGHTLDGWETLALGLAGGLLAHVAPPIAAALILAVMARLFFISDMDPRAHELAPLAALGAIALVAMIGGPQATIGATLVWRVVVELAARRGDERSGRLLELAAPAAMLLHLLHAPSLFVVTATCVAGVVWSDWLIRRLAEWRLDAPMIGAREALGAQAATLAPLLLFPAAQECLAAFVAMGLARSVSLSAPVSGYATAR